MKLLPNDAVSSWFDIGKWNAELGKGVEPYLRASFHTGGKNGIAQVSSDLTFRELTPAVGDALEKHRMGMVQSVNGTTAKGLRGTLSAGVALGETIPELRKRVGTVFEGLEKYASGRIARTETIWAYNAGAVEGYKQSGVVTKKQWWAAMDDRTCPFCEEMHEKIIDVDAEFFNKGSLLALDSGSELNFDYEDVGHPPLHPNCRCTILPVVEDF